MEEIIYVVKNVVIVIGIAVSLYQIPYFIARGWNAGKRDGNDK